MRVLAIPGSLRAASSNRVALQAASRLAPAGVSVLVYAAAAQLPHFNPDLDGDSPPDGVRSLRAEVGRADALLLAVPEYAHGVPGSFKNLLDWLVGSIEFPGKPVALVNTSPRAHHAQDQLVEVLSTMSARLVREAFVTLPLSHRAWTPAEIIDDPGLSGPIVAALAVLRATVGARSAVSEPRRSIDDRADDPGQTIARH